MEKKQLKDCLSDFCENTCKGAETVGAAVKAGAEKVEETAENVLAYTKAKLAVMELKSAVLADLKILKGNTVSMGVFLSTVEGIHASFS